MANPIFEQMSNGNDIVQRFLKFKSGFSGDAQQQVQQLLNSGRITQQQYDSAVRMAQQFQRMLYGR